MPTEYKRKCPERAQWSQETLVTALQAINTGQMGVNEASRTFGVPSRTLRRRKANNNSEKTRLGPASLFGKQNEEKLVSHIKKMQSRGFAPTRDDLRHIAYKFATALKIHHKFDVESERAGYDWVNSFLRRNTTLSVRKSEGVSVARAQGMVKTRVEQYFQLMFSVLQENDILDKPANLYNMDETGLQLNNNATHVIATKGSKLVPAITSGERGETITLIACCNAEGNFLPPVFIMKGKNKKTEYEDGMPPGSYVYMNPKSAYINSDIFFDWLKTQFVPRKPPGKVLLLVDGHSSHHSCIETLEYAEKHDIIMLSLPSHTTHFLQPLDRAVFKSLKTAWNNVCNKWMRSNPSRKINRLQFGHLVSEAWAKAATCSNAVSSFRSTGIYPYNPDSIPDYAYLVDENNQNVQMEEGQRSEFREESTPGASTRSDPVLMEEEDSKSVEEPSTSFEPGEEESRSVAEPAARPNSVDENEANEITPGKLLQQLNPIPQSSAVENARKRGQNVATILTSDENLTRKKLKLISSKKCQPKNIPGKEKKAIKKKVNQKRRKTIETDSDSNSEQLVFQESDVSGSEDESCVGCGEEYAKTTKKEDWIQCLYCKKWYHECCSKYTNLCDSCGKLLAQTKQ